MLGPGSKALVSGVISYRDILTAYKNRLEDDDSTTPNISLKRKSLRVLLRGQAMFQKQKSEIE